MKPLLSQAVTDVAVIIYYYCSRRAFVFLSPNLVICLVPT